MSRRKSPIAQESLNRLFGTARLYSESLLNKTIEFLSLDHNEVISTNVDFTADGFSHLMGVRYAQGSGLSAKDVFFKALSQELKAHEIYYTHNQLNHFLNLGTPSTNKVESLPESRNSFNQIIS